MEQHPEIHCASELDISRNVMAIFCEDIRREVSGKLIVIGMYGDGMIVPSFPIEVPQLTVLIRAVTPHTEPFQNFIVRTYLGANCFSVNDTIDKKVQHAFAHRDPPSENPPGQQLVSRIQMYFTLPVFDVHEPEVLRVRVETEAGILRAGALTIDAAA